MRFQNCDLREVSEKLYWDLKHIEHDEAYDFTFFAKVLVDAEHLFPGVIKAMPLEVMKEELMRDLCAAFDEIRNDKSIKGRIYPIDYDIMYS